MKKPDDTAAQTSEHAAPARTKWATMAASALATLLVAGELSMAAFALPLIGDDLGVSTGATAWVLLAYQLPMAALALPAGRWTDKADSRLVFTLALLTLAAADVLAGLAPQFWLLLAARVLQGFAAALYLGVYLPVVSAAVRHDQRGRAMSYHTALMMVGSVAVAPLGGWLADSHGWRAVFLARVPPLVLAALLGWITVPPAAPGPGGRRLPSPDRGVLADVALIGTAVTAGLLAVEHGGRHPVPAAALAAGAVALGVWWARLPASRPVTSLVRRPSLRLPALALLGNAALVGLTSFLLPFFISDVLGRSPELLGTAIGVFVVVSALVTPLAGVLADRFDPRSVAAAGGALTVLAMVPMFTLDAGAGPVDVTWRLCLVGAAMSLFNSPNMTAILAAVPEGRAGSAGGITNLARTLGQTAGPALAAFGWSAAAGGVAGFRAGAAALTGCVLVAFLALLAARRHRPHGRAPD
ncbi:MFS transporter [Streptomyces sp. MAR4 CNX-425]|uniref:MFS transporter n=1 Tax=Streptomyces sp. MAR4 CNX-425 TaxID=3406343 RepID=UPI003B5106C8